MCLCALYTLCSEEYSKQEKQKEEGKKVNIAPWFINVTFKNRCCVNRIPNSKVHKMSSEGKVPTLPCPQPPVPIPRDNLPYQFLVDASKLVLCKLNLYFVKGFKQQSMLIPRIMLWQKCYYVGFSWQLTPWSLRWGSWDIGWLRSPPKSVSQ